MVKAHSVLFSSFVQFKLLDRAKSCDLWCFVVNFHVQIIFLASGVVNIFFLFWFFSFFVRFQCGFLPCSTSILDFWFNVFHSSRSFSLSTFSSFVCPSSSFQYHGSVSFWISRLNRGIGEWGYFLQVCRGGFSFRHQTPPPGIVLQLSFILNQNSVCLRSFFCWTVPDDRAESRTILRVVCAGEIRFLVQITVSWAADEMKLLARAPAKRTDKY